MAKGSSRTIKKLGHKMKEHSPSATSHSRNQRKKGKKRAY